MDEKMTWKNHVEHITSKMSKTVGIISRTKHILPKYVLHCVSKKLPPLNSLQLCQILTDFQNFCTAGKRMKFATKRM